MAKEIDAKRYISEGLEMFKANTNILVVLTIAFFVISAIPVVFPPIAVILTGPLTGALFLAIMDLNAGEQLDPKKLGESVVAKIVPLILAGIAVFFLTGLGFILVIPGILLTGWYLFTFLFILDRDMDFWAAMEASRQVAFENQVGMFVFALFLILINLVGAILLGIGLLVSVPVTACATFKAYQDVVGLANDPKTSIGTGGKVMTSKPQMKVSAATPPPPPPKKK